MSDQKSDPLIDAMLAGAEIEKGTEDDQQAEHTPRTHPVDLPPTGESSAPLTTDDEAQVDDSVVTPESS